MKFSVTAHHNEYLPAGDATVDIIVTVRAEDDGSDIAVPGTGTGLAEVILLDCSGSMGAPQTKMRAAQLATIAAIDVLPDGVAFAVVGGSHVAEMIYPLGREPAVADEGTRADARKAVRRATPHGGTAIGTWLRLARELVAQRPDAIGHAVLLTDGRNESEPAGELSAALEACDGAFTVDCRGIGSAEGSHDWDGDELLRIADALGANPVVPVEDTSTLTADFSRVLAHAMASRAGDVRLRIRHAEVARIRFVKQVYPVIADLTGRDTAAEFPTGAWSPGDQRDYHVALDVDPMAAGQRRRIAWFSAFSSPGGTDPDEAGITVEWTDEFPLFSAVHPTVAHYAGQQDLAEAIRRGLAALEAGDREEAGRQFGVAAALAHAAGDTAKLDLLTRVVDIDDAAAGKVRICADVNPRMLPPLTATGPQTSRWNSPGAAAAAGGTDKIQPWRHHDTTWTGRFCGRCGVRYDRAG
ncbi:VWA domain-containing protein [Winogradskya consettensis]|uniref:VWA domain-containing protein n=1 Tax=Winogradskya consettensis TaxID=113560 RepID=A0A919SDQ5_9ACTN|nr:vWA domain-containing protein [Actinoplanes consettensis]GIM69859.1 VWA domain-containing protein [Actinoplanes consettensis]